MTQRDVILQDIGRQLDSMPQFGQLQVFVKSHVGMLGKVDMVKMTTTKYTDNDPNVSAAADIYRMIKVMSDARVNGSLGFSVTFKHGLAETMQVQDFRKI